MTSIVYDFDVISSRRPGATEPGELTLAGPCLIADVGNLTAATETTIVDKRILELFDEWLPALRHANCGFSNPDDSNPDFSGACDRVLAIEEAIADSPATGLPGLAIKVFLDAYCAAGGPGGGLAVSVGQDRLKVSILADIARFVPELAPLCAPILA
jgi:hypothetical protein